MHIFRIEFRYHIQETNPCKKKRLKEESEETTTHEKKKKKTTHDLHRHKEVQTRRGMDAEETVDNVGKGIVEIWLHHFSSLYQFTVHTRGENEPERKQEQNQSQKSSQFYIFTKRVKLANCD